MLKTGLPTHLMSFSDWIQNFLDFLRLCNFEYKVHFQMDLFKQMYHCFYSISS